MFKTAPSAATNGTITTEEVANNDTLMVTFFPPSLFKRNGILSHFEVELIWRKQSGGNPPANAASTETNSTFESEGKQTVSLTPATSGNEYRISVVAIGSGMLRSPAETVDVTTDPAGKIVKWNRQ